MHGQTPPISSELLSARVHAAALARGSLGLRDPTRSTPSSLSPPAHPTHSTRPRAQNAVTQVARLLSSSLPHVYEEQGSVTPAQSVMVGGAVDAESLNKTIRDAGARVEADVVAPLAQWLSLYDTLVAKNKELESLRLEVDSRRRTVADLTVKEAAQRAKLQRAADAKQESRLDEVVRTLQHKTDKLNASQAEYAKFEEELHARLVGLIRDAAYVKVHLGAALGTLGGALQSVSKQVDAVPIPEITVAAGPSLSGSAKQHATTSAGAPGASPRSSAITPTAAADPSNPFVVPQQPGTPVQYPGVHRSTVSSAV